MKKYLQILLMLGSLLFLVWLRNVKIGDDEIKNIKANPVIPTPTPIPTLTPTPTEILITPTTSINKTIRPTPTHMGLYKNGTFTGSIVDAYYGNIQVQAIISGGKIADVIFLQYPNDNPTSQYVNSQAMPLLKQEVLVAQSANVSGVSGASATLPAFIVSLTNALNQAKN